ncbi:MAG: bifunctional 5,10-methylenetetrahydrofolate dehydrogenase/5,10-methenyltetrahydrofolate cyclohydrolase [Lactobacillaceae bacterium]|jgi:methylenetetrahydrofolate dehydrogenase (NADP+)/methenyltetrahydrofolate cyclohydrolase|nr:bifunctional 5,10-methylenetetrahydrofolate dehydrogenase/5,10-methenyltetrahydrofolate cyclohydrolase [Lactobacillaceae bacterium]
MSEKLDGKALAAKINEETKNIIDQLEDKPTLATIYDPENYGSEMYVKMKHKKANELGINTLEYPIQSGADTSEVLEIVRTLNNNPQVDGILVQSPLPNSVNETEIFSALKPRKDVDGLNYQNQGRLFENLGDYIEPATPGGIFKLLDEYKIDLVGKDVVVMGASQLLGRPTALMFLNRGATVTIVHSKTRKEVLIDLLSKADVVSVGIGQAQFVQAEWLKDGVVIIDAGSDKLDGKTVGDVHPDAYQKSSYYTPVPGGVGPMTIATLLRHVAETKAKEN